MLYGVHLSAQGAALQSFRQDVIANNIANASTTAFKADMVRAQSHMLFDKAQGRPERLPPSLEHHTGGVAPNGVVTNFTPGPIQPTGTPLDLAILGQGFLRVTDGEQETLTRDGRLTINESGRLVTVDDGLQVLNAAGSPIAGLDPGSPTDILPDGSISQRGATIGRIGLFVPESLSRLQKQGQGQYAFSGDLKLAGPEVSLKSGALEDSGVDPLRETVEMIQASRAYEANINMIKYQDESLGRLLSSAASRS